VIEDWGGSAEEANFGDAGSETSKKKTSFCPLRTERRPPHASTFPSLERPTWCGSLLDPPGAGSGTVFRILP
jgi:hypothetical protein